MAVVLVVVVVIVVAVVVVVLGTHPRTTDLTHTRALESIFYYIRSPDMGGYGGYGGYGRIQRDTAKYSGIQRDTAGYSWIQWDTAGSIKIYSRARVHTDRQAGTYTSGES